MSAEVISLVPTPHFCELPIASIRVEDRHRTDLGDLRSLADSIDTIGLIHPVVVTPDNGLIAGARRLAAMQLLGWDVIPVTVIHTLADATDRLMAERDENTCRKSFSASELVAIGRRLEELERPKAEERQREAGRQFGRGIVDRSGSTEPDLSPQPTDKVVGEALGVSQSTYKRAKAVVKALEDDSPEVRDVAQRELTKLDAGETTYSASAQAVRDARNGEALTDEEKAEPEFIPELPTKAKGGHRPNHLKILTNITNTLGGFVMVLDDIEEINTTVNEEEARRLKSDLSKQIRALNRIRNLLKEV